MFERLFESKAKTAAITLGALAVSLVVLTNARTGTEGGEGKAAYAVTIRHEGVDSDVMEQDVTEPLEGWLSTVPSRTEIRSTSEYGSSRVVVYMDHLSSEAYQSVRDAAERVYAFLPPSVQRPEILSTNEGSRPVWVAAVRRLDGQPLGAESEPLLKTAFGRLPGTGQVELWGMERSRVIVSVDPHKAFAYGIGTSEVARAVSADDWSGYSGSILRGRARIGLKTEGTVKTVLGMKSLFLRGKAGMVRLGDVASVGTGSREAESISRVDGEELPVIAVNAAGSPNLMTLSASLNAAAGCLAMDGYSFEPVLDFGKDLAKAFADTVSAIVQGVFLMALCVPFVLENKRGRIASVLAVPFSALCALAMVSATGALIDRNVLAGLAIGLGTSMDTVIVAMEAAGRGKTPRDAASEIRKVLPALSGGMATTLIVLIPLSLMSWTGEGTKAIALSVAASQITCFLVSILILPRYACRTSGEAGKVFAQGRFRALALKTDRLLGRSANAAFLFVTENPFAVLVPGAVVSAVAAVFFFLCPFDFESRDQGTSFGMHAEGGAGESPGSMDRKLTRFSALLKGIDGVERTQTTAKTGAGGIEVSFNPVMTQPEKVMAAAEREGKKIADVYIRTTSAPARNERRYEISVSGDEPVILERLAKEAAGLLSGEPWVKEAVLHFKESAGRITVIPDEDRLAMSGVTLIDASEALKSFYYGPVMAKKIMDGREKDVVVQTVMGGLANSDVVPGSLTLRGQNGEVSLGDIAAVRTETGPGTIYRKDRRRAVFLSFSTMSNDVRDTKAKTLALLKAVSLPPGYAIEFDRDAIMLEEGMGKSTLAFLTSLVLVYLALGTLTGSVVAPMVCLCVVPASILPPLILFASLDGAIRMSGMAAFVVLSGMTVNSSLLVLEEWKDFAAKGSPSPRAARMAARAAVKPLACSACISILSAIPLILLPAGSAAFMKSLALATASGSFASAMSALLIVPALLSAFPFAPIKQFRRSLS